MFTLTIETSNAAFHAEEMGPEIARILARMSTVLMPISEGDSAEGTLRDVNGNTVGTWRLDYD